MPEVEPAWYSFRKCHGHGSHYPATDEPLAPPQELEQLAQSKAEREGRIEELQVSH
jgi:hypothetical protein